MPTHLQKHLFEKELGIDAKTTKEVCQFVTNVMLGCSWECKCMYRDVKPFATEFFGGDVTKMFAFMLKLMEEKKTKSADCWPIFNKQYSFMPNFMIWH